MRLRYRTTTSRDLKNLVDLWNDGEVMKFVGFPQGLGYDSEKAARWLETLNQKKDTAHFSIYDQGDFLGELFYSYRVGEKAIVDIKLKKSARGKNVGFRAFSFLLDQLFRNTEAKTVTVDPHAENYSAIRLYERCAFQYQEITYYQGEPHKVFDLDRNRWRKKRLQGIHFEDVDSENYKSIVDLVVTKEQQDFIATNVFSLVQAAYEPNLVPKGIYSDDTPVGFLMWCTKDSDDGLVWIYRLMVDWRYQGLGYGKRAMELILPYLKTISKEKRIRISFEPENSVAKALYEQMGFITTGVISGGEIIYEMKF